jgi:hypothetical protein
MVLKEPEGKRCREKPSLGWENELLIETGFESMFELDMSYQWRGQMVLDGKEVVNMSWDGGFTSSEHTRSSLSPKLHHLR